MTHSFNDPDFDEPQGGAQHHSKGSLLGQLSPSAVFVGGVLMGIMVLCTIGFLILLALFFKGGLDINTANADSGSPPIIGAILPPQPRAQAPAGAVPPVTKADHVRGDQNAALTWIEYSDFECPFCKRFHPSMLQMMEEYKGKIKWVYRHFPLSFHANAQKQAEASDCAAELGGNDAFWKYSDAILERTTSNGTGFALNALVPLAKELGLNEKKFKECLDSEKYAKHVADDINGGSAAGVNGTPGSFLIGKDGKAQLVSGALPYEQIKALVEAELK